MCKCLVFSKCPRLTLPSMLHTVCAFFVILFHYFIKPVQTWLELTQSQTRVCWMDGRKMSQHSTIISVPVKVCSANVMNGSFVLGLLWLSNMIWDSTHTYSDATSHFEPSKTSKTLAYFDGLCDLMLSFFTVVFWIGCRKHCFEIVSIRLGQPSGLCYLCI